MVNIFILSFIIACMSERMHALIENKMPDCPKRMDCITANECFLRNEKRRTFLPCEKGVCCPKKERGPRERLELDEEDFKFDPRQHKNFKNLPKLCGEDVTSLNRMQNGENGEEGEFPWMVYMSVKGRNKMENCSGVLITLRHVLTAGHCAIHYADKPHRIRVFAGVIEVACTHTYSECPTLQRRMVQQVNVHKAFNQQTLSNDIAILRLRRSFNLSEFVIPVCLPLEERASKGLGRRNLTLAGWGPNINLDRVLQKITVDFIPYEICAKQWKDDEMIIRKSQRYLYSRGAHDAKCGIIRASLVPYGFKRLNKGK